MSDDARRQELVYRESTRRTACPVIEKIYAHAGTDEAECFLAQSRIILWRDNSLYVLLFAISRWLLLVDRRAACDGAHDLDIFDFLLVHGVRIVCQHDEVRQLARRDRSFDRFLM